MSCRILCVDDEIGICRFIEQTLTLEDFEVEVFDDPEAALEHLNDDHDFAVIISDYRMPKIHGIEFLSRSRRLAPQAVRMMLTAFGNTINFNEAKEKVKLFNYMSKPIGPDELVFHVERAIEQYELQTNQRCREESDGDDDWDEVDLEDREAALLLCHLSGWDHGAAGPEGLVYLPGKCFDLISKIAQKYQGQMFNQEGAASISIFEKGPLEETAPAALRVAWEAKAALVEVLEKASADQGAPIRCSLVLSAGGYHFLYDHDLETQTLSGPALDQARELAESLTDEPVTILLTEQAGNLLKDNDGIHLAKSDPRMGWELKEISLSSSIFQQQFRSAEDADKK